MKSTIHPVREPLVEKATYTVAQLADLLDVSQWHVHGLRDRKAMPGEILVGRCVRFARSVTDRWLAGSSR